MLRFDLNLAWCAKRWVLINAQSTSCLPRRRHVGGMSGSASAFDFLRGDFAIQDSCKVLVISCCCTSLHNVQTSASGKVLAISYSTFSDPPCLEIHSWTIAPPIYYAPLSNFRAEPLLCIMWTTAIAIGSTVRHFALFTTQSISGPVAICQFPRSSIGYTGVVAPRPHHSEIGAARKICAHMEVNAAVKRLSFVG